MTLRRPWAADRGWILRLRNHPAIIALSRCGQRAAPGWWQAVRPQLLIICQARWPLGYVIADVTGEVSIVLLPDAQGHGFGPEALRALAILRPGPKWALIRPENAASIRAFEKAGYVQDGCRDDCLLYRLP